MFLLSYCLTIRNNNNNNNNNTIIITKKIRQQIRQQTILKIASVLLSHFRDTFNSFCLNIDIFNSFCL